MKTSTQCAGKIGSISFLGLLGLILILPVSLRADVSLPPIFSDHAVLQKAARVPIWGKALLANNPELVFIGDSITARWPAELLQEKFGAFRPVNLGMGGDGIQNVLWRLQNGVLDKIHPKVIVLLIGTNNITIGMTPDQIAEGIAALIKAIQEKAPASKILLLGILPRGESIQEANNEKIRQTNAKLALLADNKRIFYLDVGDKLVEPDGSISREIMPDKLHVAEPGYTRWMDAMKPTLDKLLNE